MSDRIRARVIRVRVDKHSATLASTAAVGATQLLVTDAGDLAGDGVETGTLLVNDDSAALLNFTDITFVEDTDQGDLTSPDIVTLTAPLATAIDPGTELFAWETPDDPSDDGVVAEVIARCIPEDDEDASETGDPIRAVVPPELQDDLPAGRSDAKVILEYDDDADEWVVLRLRGTKRGMRAEADDFHVLTAADKTAGTVTIALSHLPIKESIKAFAGPLFQKPSNYTVDYQLGTVTWPLDGWEPVGLRLAVHYWYQAGRLGGIVVPFGASGWRTLGVTRASTADYSSPTFDDSAWTTQAAAFGTGTGSPWAAPTTTWATDSAIWLRRAVGTIAGRDHTVTIRVDDYAEVYWNGALVGTVGSKSPGYRGETALSIDGADVLSSNTLAIRAADKDGVNPPVPANVTYIDAQVSR